jgi:ABC-type transport system substrate-binding protein
MELSKSGVIALTGLLLVVLGLSGCGGEAPSTPSPAATSTATESSEPEPTETEEALPPFALESMEAVETNFGDCVAALSDPGEYTYRAKSSPEGAGTVTFKSETHTLVWDTAPSKTGALLTIPNLATDDLFWDSGCYD